MDLGTHATSTTSVLSRLRTGVADREASLIREWAGIVAWASDNVVATKVGAATITDGYLDTGVPIAGEGAPLVSEFGLMELVAVLGRSPDGGKAYVGRVIECAWRLPHVYKAVLDGKLAPWRAERIADLTLSLSADAAAFVDRQLFDASGVGWAQLERLVAEAVMRFGPAQAEADREKGAYEILRPGTNFWTSPTDTASGVDHRGTHPIHDTDPHDPSAGTATDHPPD